MIRRFGSSPRSKYGASKTVVDGITFDSKKEAIYYGSVSALKRAGAISGFDRQVPFICMVNDKKCFTYRADFVIYENNGTRRVVDVKGFRTAVYRLKKKCIEAQYGFKIEEV